MRRQREIKTYNQFRIAISFSKGVFTNYDYVDDFEKAKKELEKKGYTNIIRLEK